MCVTIFLNQVCFIHRKKYLTKSETKSKQTKTQIQLRLSKLELEYSNIFQWRHILNNIHTVSLQRKLFFVLFNFIGWRAKWKEQYALLGRKFNQNNNRDCPGSSPILDGLWRFRAWSCFVIKSVYGTNNFECAWMFIFVNIVI